MLRQASWWIVETRLLRRIGQYIKAHQPLLTQCHQELPSTTNILSSDVETRLLVNCWNTPLAPQGTWQPTAFRWSFLQQPTTTDNLTENRSFLQLTIFSTTNNRTENNKSRESLWITEAIIGTFKFPNMILYDYQIQFVCLLNFRLFFSCQNWWQIVTPLWWECNSTESFGCSCIKCQNLRPLYYSAHTAVQLVHV